MNIQTLKTIIVKQVMQIHSLQDQLKEQEDLTEQYRSWWVEECEKNGGSNPEIKTTK